MLHHFFQSYNITMFSSRTGYIVASNPVKTIAIAIVVSLLCLVGVVEYYAENQGEKLWVSSNSKGLEHQKWVGDRFPAESRIVNLIAEFGNNLLTPAGLQKVFNLEAVSLREKCPNTGKYGPEITPYVDTFHAVSFLDV